MEVKEISCLDREEIMQAIFGRKLPEIKIKNNFEFLPSTGYYAYNTPTIRVGLVFKTPTGRNSKMYEYIRVKVNEKEISGKCNYFASEESPKKLFEKIERYTSPENISEWISFHPLLRNKDRQKHCTVVISTGAGCLPVYLLKSYSI